jgi:hypothetical protein
MDVYEYEEIFRNAGFAGRRLGWQERDYPRISLLLRPEPAGCERSVACVDVVYVASEQDDRQHSLPDGETICLTGSGSQARALAEAWAKRALKEVGDEDDGDGEDDDDEEDEEEKEAEAKREVEDDDDDDDDDDEDYTWRRKRRRRR